MDELYNLLIILWSSMIFEGRSRIFVDGAGDPFVTRTAVENGEGVLDKEATSHSDVFDVFRMSLLFWH